MVLRDPEDKGLNLSFQGRDWRPRSRSWLHLDLYTRTSRPKLSDWSLWERGDIPFRSGHSAPCQLAERETAAVISARRSSPF
jgi:hypothetical protein